MSRYNQQDKFKRVYNTIDAVRGDLISGVDPLSGSILDRSIARSYPICNWKISIFSEFPLTSPRVTEYNVSHDNNPLLNNKADTQSTFNYITSHTFRYGKHQITMTPYASNSNTDSDKSFIQYVEVVDMPPFANFIINANAFETISSSYVLSAGRANQQAYTLNPFTSTDSNGEMFTYVSGYAPYLKLTLQDTSKAHTFPIEKYEWDFGDIYNEGPSNVYDKTSNYYTVEAKQILRGDYNTNPNWLTDASNHIAEHIYVMPGVYNVTLTTSASVTNTQDTCAKYINTNKTNKFFVYLEEIPPRCGSILGSLSPNITSFTSALSTITGSSPVTAYFTAKEFVQGSFPFCRMDWQIGPHKETILKYPLTRYTTQGLALSVIDTTKPKDDLTNLIIPIIINSDSTDLLSVSVSSYVCNTNTFLNCTPCGDAAKRFYSIPTNTSKEYTTNILSPSATYNTQFVKVPGLSLSGITPATSFASAAYYYNISAFPNQILTNVSILGYHAATYPSFDDLVTIKVGESLSALQTIDTTTNISSLQITSNNFYVVAEMEKVGAAIDFGPSIYNIILDINEATISANAPCNTKLGLINPVEQSIVQEDKKLIGTRIDDNGNLLYIFEGQEQGHLYTVALSGEIND